MTTQQYLDEATVQWIFGATRNWTMLNAGREPPTLEEIRATTAETEFQWLYPHVAQDFGQHGHFCKCDLCDSARTAAITAGAENFGAIFEEWHARFRSLDKSDPMYDLKKAELKRQLNTFY